MNILEYRRMVEEQKNSAPKTEEGKEQSDVQAQQSNNGEDTTSQTPPAHEQGSVDKETNPTETTPPSTEEPKEEVDKIEIDGKEYTLDEIKEFQKGYLRQSDYTRKTQELAKEKKRLEDALKLMDSVQNNPNLAQTISQETNINLDPNQMKIQALEAELNTILVQQEITELENKFPDFDAEVALKLAGDYNLPNLEVAYHYAKSTGQLAPTQETKPSATEQPQAVDVEAIKSELREELKRELLANQDTSSIIGTNGGSAPKKDTTPKLSAKELKVAQMMGMKPDEYAKWRDAK